MKEPVPALVPLTVKEEWCRLLQGLSLKNVSVTLFSEKKKKLYEGFGEMLFTHFGISGPLILSASSYYVKKGKKEPVSLVLDLKPALSMEPVSYTHLDVYKRQLLILSHLDLFHLRMEQHLHMVLFHLTVQGIYHIRGMV